MRGRKKGTLNGLMFWAPLGYLSMYHSFYSHPVAIKIRSKITSSHSPFRMHSPKVLLTSAELSRSFSSKGEVCASITPHSKQPNKYCLSVSLLSELPFSEANGRDRVEGVFLHNSFPRSILSLAFSSLILSSKLLNASRLS